MNNKGIWYGVFCYVLWGFLPLYWKLLEAVPAVEIVAHRLIWSLLFLLIVVLVGRKWNGFRGALAPRTLLIYLAASAILSVNWLVYIYGVNAGFVVETSLGYFINPLVSVIFGVIFFKERLPVSKWIPIGLATAGVIYLTVRYGSLPWIALVLAFSFGLYGLIKKLSPLDALNGLVLETAGMFLPALGYLIYLESQGQGTFGHSAPLISALMALTGIVTAVPLLLFSSAARSIPLSMVGILQYISPTIQFFLGILVYHEPFTQDRLVGFGIIWIALLLFSLSGVYERRKALQAAAI